MLCFKLNVLLPNKLINNKNNADLKQMKVSVVLCNAIQSQLWKAVLQGLALDYFMFSILIFILIFILVFFWYVFKIKALANAHLIFNSNHTIQSSFGMASAGIIWLVITDIVTESDHWVVLWGNGSTCTLSGQLYNRSSCSTLQCVQPQLIPG